MIAAFLVLLALATSPGTDAPDGTLRVTLHADTTVVPMGEPMTVRLALRADSALVARGTLLNRNRGGWTCTLVFTNARTGAGYERPHYDVGMPPSLDPARFVALGDVPVEETAQVYLLSRDGQQIPPGRYRVHAEYENTGLAGVAAGNRLADPARLWTGSIASEAITIDVEEAAPRPETFDVPARITFRVFPDRSQIGAYWATGSARAVDLEHRPGYTVGWRYRVSALVDGETSEYAPRAVGSPDWSSSATAVMLPPDVSDPVLRGATLELLFDIEVFETSVPAGHLWNPEAGDFAVLWSGEVRATYP